MGGGAAEPPPAPRRRARLLLREGAARLPGGAAPPAAAPPHLRARGGSAPAGCRRLSRRSLCGGHRRPRDLRHRRGHVGGARLEVTSGAGGARGPGGLKPHNSALARPVPPAKLCPSRPQVPALLRAPPGPGARRDGAAALH